MNHESDDMPVVLIVDDDAQTRLLVRETLEPEGFGIEEAASGDAGLEAFRHVRPDLVVLDVTAGHERVRVLRAHAAVARRRARSDRRPHRPR